jgi:hypothetical protein
MKDGRGTKGWVVMALALLFVAVFGVVLVLAMGR